MNHLIIMTWLKVFQDKTLSIWKVNNVYDKDRSLVLWR